MKKIIGLLLGIVLSLSVFAATTVPISLINPSGSTAGQAIISAGPGAPPAWGPVALTGVTGTLSVAKGGTGATSLTAHAVVISQGTAAYTGVGPGANGQMLLGVSSSDPYWGNNPAISGGTVDNSPIGNTTASTGKFTSLSATSTVSGAGFSTYFASPPAIGGTAPAAGSFTTLSASTNDALMYSNTSAQSIPNNTPTTLTTFTKVYDRVNANFNASTGTFTAPATGVYQVGGAVTFSTATGVSGAIYTTAVVANGATVAQGRFDQTATASVPVQVAIPPTVVSLAAGQTIIIQVSQSTGAARTLSSAAALTFVSINRLP